MEIMRCSLGTGDVQREHAFRLDGNNVILVLQNTFHHEKLLGTHQQPILLKQPGINDGVCYSGFIFQA